MCDFWKDYYSDFAKDHQESIEFQESVKQSTKFNLEDITLKTTNIKISILPEELQRQVNSLSKGKDTEPDYFSERTYYLSWW